MSFEEQIDEIRISCIIDYFKDKNLLNFLKMHINVDNLLQNYKNKTKNKFSNKSLCETLDDIENLVDDILIKELLSTIKMQICDKEKYNKEKIKYDINKEQYYIDKEQFNIDKEQFNIDKKQYDKNNRLENILEKLKKMFPTSQIEMKVTEYFNIYILKENNKPNIHIYSHILNTNILSDVVDEFYKLTKEFNCCAILCNRDYGIYNKNSFEIDIQDNNVNMFLPNYNQNDQFNLAVQIIYHIYENIKDNTGCIELDKDLFHRLKLEYSYFLTMHIRYLNSIKGNIMSLEKLQLIQLDNFFKRTHINSNDKPYACQLCGTKFGTDKSLKSHLKIKHQIQLGKTRNKKIKEDEVEEESEKDGMVTFD